jgi:hypothetical protein
MKRRKIGLMVVYRFLEKLNLLKDLAQDCDLLRRQLDEELIAKVSRSEPLVVCALFMRRSGRKLVIP